MKQYIFILSVLFLLTIPTVYAEDTFKTIGDNIWHKSNPTICITEPEPSLQ